MSRLTPTIFKAHLAQRLREEGVRQQRSPEHVRQVVLQDRFLGRVFQALGADAMLRGSRAVDLRIGDDRTARDLDLAIPGEPEVVLKRLSDAGQLDLGEYLRFYVALDNQAPTLLSEGFQVTGHRYKVQSFLVGVAYGEPFAVDVSPPEPIAGAPDVLPGGRHLAFAGVTPAEMRLLPLASHLADGLHYYTLPQPNTSHPRVWDLPELALLGTAGPIEAEQVALAVSYTFAHRATHNIPTYVPPPPVMWEPHLVKLLRDERLTWRSVPELVSVVGHFLSPVLAGGKGTWHPPTWQWSRADAT